MTCRDRPQGQRVNQCGLPSLGAYLGSGVPYKHVHLRVYPSIGLLCSVPFCGCPSICIFMIINSILDPCNSLLGLS